MTGKTNNENLSSSFTFENPSIDNEATVMCGVDQDNIENSFENVENTDPVLESNENNQNDSKGLNWADMTETFTTETVVDDGFIVPGRVARRVKIVQNTPIEKVKVSSKFNESSTEDDSSDSESLSSDESVDATPSSSPQYISSTPEKVIESAKVLLTREERRKKEMDDLDALLNEMEVQDNTIIESAETNTTADDTTPDQRESLEAQALAFLNSKVSSPEKKKTKKKKSNSKKTKVPVSAKSASHVAIAEAKVRQEKLKAQKKKTRSENHDHGSSW